MADALDKEPLALEVKKLTKVFGDRKALDNVSFSLPQGAFLSIFGPNGAGKTTMLRMLSTLARPTSGAIRVMGLDAKEDPDKVRDHIGLISHNSMLYPDLTAMENMMFVARLYGIINPEARVRELLRAVELDHRRFDMVRTFSRGMTQRLSIARALINDPEPYAGLDPHAVEIFDELIGGLREERTFVMVSHDLQKGFSACTHAMMLARGRVMVCAPKDELDFDEFKGLYRETVGMGVA